MTNDEARRHAGRHHFVFRKHLPNVLPSSFGFRPWSFVILFTALRLGLGMETMLEVSQSVIPGQQIHDGKPFPLVLECHTSEATLADTIAWLAERRGEARRPVG